MKFQHLFATAILATIASAASAQDTIAKDLVASWDYNEAAGSTTVADYKGLATGTAGSGVTRVAGPGAAFGNAGYFDGTANAKIDLVRSTEADSPNATSLSFSFWAKFDKDFNATTAGRNYESIFQGSASGQDNFIVYKDNFNKMFRLKVIVVNGATTYVMRRSLQTTELPSIGAWHHFACIFDGTGATPDFAWYVDGVKATNVHVGNDASGSGNGTIRQPQTSSIGTKTGAAGQELIGSMDDLAIWKRPLSAGEVSFIYNNGKQLKDIMNVKLNVADWSQF